MIKHVDVSGRDALAFDSTQTIRALTPRELADAEPRKWFAVQLAVSDQPPNLDIMPRLDIFTSRRLYTVVARSGTVVLHSLRLGFFEETAASGNSSSQKPMKKSKSLSEELMEEAREIQRAKSRKTPASTSSTGSWLARLFGASKV